MYKYNYICGAKVVLCRGAEYVRVLWLFAEYVYGKYCQLKLCKQVKQVNEMREADQYGVPH